MSSKVDVWNLALHFLDLSQTIKGENDNSEAAGACNAHYDFARKKVLERAYWDFATKSPALALILDQSTLAANAVVYPGFRYVYRRPADCLRMLAVTTQYGLRTNPYLYSWWGAAFMPSRWTMPRVAFREALDQVDPANPGQAINVLSDQDAAYAVYVADVTNTNLWSQSFTEAVAWQLAVPIAGPVSAKTSARENAAKMAEFVLTQALQVQFGERGEDPYPESPAISARI